MAEDLSNYMKPIRDLQQAVERLQQARWLENASVTNGRVRFVGGTLRVDSGGSVQIVGSLEIDGTTTISGSFVLSGPNWQITGNGTISGNVTITGALNVNGPTTINGATTLNNTLTVSSGQIRAGDVTITPSGGGLIQVSGLYIDGSRGGNIRSASSVNIEGGGTTSLRVIGQMTASEVLVLGDIVGASLNITGPKSFRMPHPSKPGHWLRHGSTESPVSGVEYWGEGVVGQGGSVDVHLPDYFEDLAKPENRSVFVTGRGHSPDWSDIDDGTFTVTGTPGGRFSWLVKAERFGGDFVLEEEIPAPDEDEE